MSRTWLDVFGPGADNRPPSERQLERLDELAGILGLEQVPDAPNMAQAWHLIGRMGGEIARRREAECDG